MKLLIDCDYCGEEFDAHIVDSTWQQWLCPCCGSWVDMREPDKESSATGSEKPSDLSTN